MYKRQPLGIPKNRKIFDFRSQHGGKLAPKSMPKSMLSSKGAFLKKPSFSFRKNFFEIQGVEVESKNRSKIDIKNDAEPEGLGNSILIDFWWIWEASWPSKTEPRRSKIDVEKASKFDQFLKASWNAIFSAQEPPRRASAADRRRRWSRPEATGGGFRRGKTRTSEKKNPEGEYGRIRRPRMRFHTSTP